MGIYNEADSGTKVYRSRFSKSISNTMRYDCRFHELIPVLKRFVLPGDVWKIGGDALIRFQPMFSPSMTPYTFRVRYFFVPLRLIEENTELIITGSVDGELYNSTLPVFDNFVKNADKVKHASAYIVPKYGFWDYMNVQTGDYENIKNDKCLPANYWDKAYTRIWFDYYRDENYSLNGYSFDQYYDYRKEYGCSVGLFSSNLGKDYFTSALPWQLKGTAPRLNVQGDSTIRFNFGDLFYETEDVTDQANVKFNAHIGLETSNAAFDVTKQSGVLTEEQVRTLANTAIKGYLNSSQSNIPIAGLGFNADEFRTMMAQTRIFERLARCGSRYTEYLRSNFGLAPADDTLQRAQYLGGWKIPIVTTEVLQTAPDGSTPVGTMRGHGISRGGNNINTFRAKEFGLLFGLAEVRPQVEYTTGIPRQLSYKERFDFFNPSFQHLSEQEVRNGELFISFTDNKNDDTFGFQAYGNELRSSQDEVVGDMRDSLSYWGSSLHFSSRPNAIGLVNSVNHLASFNAPFVNQADSARPVLVTFRNNLDVYRPMVRFATPGLVDHL